MEPRHLKLNFGKVEKVDSREEMRDIKMNNTKAGESSGIVRNLKKEAAETRQVYNGPQVVKFISAVRK